LAEFCIALAGTRCIRHAIMHANTAQTVLLIYELMPAINLDEVFARVEEITVLPGRTVPKP
jgi:hypothetical protein